jgi:hypothetical protein
MPGPLFAVTINKASKSKTSGALIAVGHGIVEVPLMFLIFFVLKPIPNPKRGAGNSGGGGWFLDDFHGFTSVQKQK